MNTSEAQSTQPPLPPRTQPTASTSQAHSPQPTPTASTSQAHSPRLAPTIPPSEAHSPRPAYTTTPSETRELKPEKPGSLIGSRIKGIARIIHGAGEAVRGYGMSTLDNTISNNARGTAENGEITRRGQEEIQRGLDDLKWKDSSSD